MKKVVITGRGTISPMGQNPQEFWNNLLKNNSCISLIDNFDTSDSKIKVAGQIKKTDKLKIPKRLDHKIDKFIRYALYASDEAIKESKIVIDKNNSYNIGIFVGNNSGGWDISERGFKELYSLGANYVNPWQATAWFPAAPQGYISIVNKIHGYSKSFVADRCSGSVALKFAFESILDGKNNIVVYGGCEAPITKLGTVCYAQNESFYPGTECSDGSMPFSNKTHGEILAEGSTFLILEDSEVAIKRGAHIFAEVLGVNTNYGNYDKCMDDLLSKHKINYEDIDLFLPDGSGEYQADIIEENFVKNKLHKRTLVTIPKAQFGHMYGASTPTDMLASLFFMQNSYVTSTIGVYNTCNSVNILKKNQQKDIQIILLGGRSREGINSGILIRRWKNNDEE